MEGKAPTVVTLSAIKITQTSAVIQGTITDDGGLPCYGWFEDSSGLSTTLSVSGKPSAQFNPFTFASRLTGLKPGTLYTYTAYASNEAGIGNGGTLSFITTKQGKTGSISIKTTPSNASVTLDGEKQSGLTPMIISPVITGQHTLLIKKDNYKDLTKK